VHGVLFFAFLIGALGTPAPLADAATGAAGPWRLSQAAALPDGLAISGTQRTRYETLDGQFRAGREGGDQMLALRTTLRVEVSRDAFGLVGELADSRQKLADTGTPIATSMVNTLELLQAYAVARFDGPLVEGSRSEVRLGRQTVDVGSRRLMARNRFRNTINAFTGVHWQWQLPEGPTARAFYVLPVIRQPSDAESLLDNDVELDDEGFDLQLWALHVQWPGLPGSATGEVYVFALHEDDSGDRATRNRRLYTPGLRVSRAPAKGAWYFDIESVAQVGKTRGSTDPADTTDLDHLAYFQHVEVGYTFDRSWSPTVAVLYDYASGDDRPDDDDSNRFDTLFGARRFEYGPTGIYGAFARSNIQSPGYRLSARPTSRVDAMLAHRLYWLASDADGWTTSGLRDPSGDAGSFVGHQLEARLRWDILPGNLGLEMGGAHLFAGGFIDDVPNATGRGDTTYGYLALNVRF
jgi:hypothetical protein